MYLNIPWTPMDNDGTCENSQVSASKKWLILAALTCNWQVKLANFRKFHSCLPSIDAARYTQRTRQTVKSIESEKVHRIRESPSFIPALAKQPC